ncbi:hypothetical protein [Devosia sp. Leaf64]|uniref:hypothetical protein n=1 Tax=Devosia sp. Leaf64 TaxID=1736229 RepID=UPI0007127E78|nr:hypothetical protein [Devosia sp. Leaf64]KQN75087.1 hypothetical protein ASE94_01850 [Devosia sp. Leaf64]
MKTANAIYCAALNLSLHHATGDARLAIEAALEKPSPTTTRAVLRASIGQPWQPRIEGALIEIGIAASESLECSK